MDIAVKQMILIMKNIFAQIKLNIKYNVIGHVWMKSNVEQIINIDFQQMGIKL